jgi:outer membrane scaffolding protein for murein synthesis (MipA/OmpV family)
MPRRWWVAAAAAGLACCAVASAQAQAQEEPLWELGAGLGVLSLPHYRGADQSHTWWLPVPYVVYRGDLLKADRDGARARLFEAESDEINLSFGASAPTRSEDNRARQGMPDLAPTVELGPVWNHTFLKGAHHQLDLRVPLRAVFSVESPPRHLGWISTPHINLDRSLGDWNLGLLTGPVFGDRRLHQYFHGVRDSEATASRPAYRAGGGFAGWQSTVAASRQLGPLWLGLFAKFDRIGGSAMGDSPLVRERSQWSAGLALSWIFARSATMVATSP